MRPVQITTRIYPPEVAAAAFRLRALALGLAAQGADVEVLTTLAPRPERDVVGMVDPRVSVRRWPVMRDRSGAVRGFAQYASYDVPLAMRLLSLPRPDVIVAEPPPTTGAVVWGVSRLRRVPYVYYAADVWSDATAAMDVHPFLTRVLRRLEVGVLKHAERVLTVSDEVGARLRSLGVEPRRVVVVGNGVDTDVFTPDGPRPDVQYRYLVYAGTVSEWQGADVFVRALALLRRNVPDLRLVFLGQGSEMAALRSLAETECPGAVDIRGLVPPTEAAAWIRGAEAALVSIRPGLGYDFAKPTKIYAAAACGTPVVFAGVGAGAELVTRSRLGAAAAHDPASVAGALLKIIRDPDADHVSRNARWAQETVSLTRVGRLAAQSVMSAVTAGESGNGVLPRSALRRRADVLAHRSIAANRRR